MTTTPESGHLMRRWTNWKKTRADRSRWATARTLPELADLMALWVEGELSVWPGHQAPADDETTPLVPSLAAANRGGFLTDQSQPGYDGPGFDGTRWEQRAAVSGLVADEQLLTRLRQAGEAAGLLVLISHPRLLPQGHGITCTFRDGQPYTAFGEYLPPRVLRHIWRGISRPATEAVCDAWQVCLIDPDTGRNDRLWSLLDTLFATHPAPTPDTQTTNGAVMRFLTQGGATVSLYRCTWNEKYYGVLQAGQTVEKNGFEWACTGCGQSGAQQNLRLSGRGYDEHEPRKSRDEANKHAATCRAMPTAA